MAPKAKPKRASERSSHQTQTVQFCTEKAIDVSYRDVNRLQAYISERGKIVPRRISGNCAKHQRMLTVAIKRARVIAFLPYVSE